MRIWREFFSHEPSPAGRIEYAITQLLAWHVNSNLKPGIQRKPLSEFLLFKEWKDRPSADVTTAEAPTSPESNDTAIAAAVFGSRVNRKR